MQSVQTCNFSDTMRYFPRELTLSNRTNFSTEIHIDFFVPELNVSTTVEYTISPYEHVRFDKVADQLGGYLRNRTCSVSLRKPSSEVFFNVLGIPTRTSCNLLLEAAEREPDIFPQTFEDGIDLRPVHKKPFDTFNTDESKALILQYSKRYQLFLEDKKLRASKIMPRALLESESIIPQQIHFIWLGSILKRKDRANLVSFRNKHPSWQIILWHDLKDLKSSDTIKLIYFVNQYAIKLIHVESFFDSSSDILQIDKIKEFYSYAYDQKFYGMAADILRVLILWKIGGIYADCDNWCFKPFDPLVKMHNFFAGLCPINKNLVKINNDIIGSVPSHPILSNYIHLMIQSHEKYWEVTKKENIKNIYDGFAFIRYYKITRTVFSTGPIPFSKAYHQYIEQKDDPLTLIYPPDIFHPGSKDSSVYEFGDQPAPCSFSAATFDMGWVPEFSDLLEIVRSAKPDFERSIAILDHHLKKEKLEDCKRQIHFFELQIYKGLSSVIDWLIKDPKKLEDVDVLNFLLTDVTKTDIEKLIPYFNGDRLIIVSFPLIDQLNHHPNIYGFS